jgi:ubiquinone biosynthesis protein
MNESILVRRFFKDRAEVDPEQQFGLNRKSRNRRLREIIALVRKYKMLDGITPGHFRDMLVDLGPSFVKIGQMLSLRSEILPQAYCDALATLQMDADPLPFEEITKALRSIYGERFDSIFKSIDPKPLGSASLAQVHKAVLSNGDVVAVKVQRPGVRATMAQDIDVMRSLARRLSNFTKDNQMLDLRDVVEELWNTFLEETDFTKETQNLYEFSLLNKDVKFISCPMPYLEYCSEEVLVMEYVEGVSLRDTDKLVELGYDLEEIGRKALDNYATQILDFGFFHADPHPGNMFIKDGKLYYLDLGIVGRLNPRDRARFGEIIVAVGAKSATRLKDALIAFSVDHDANGIDHPRMLAELDLILDGYGSCDVADIDIGSLLNDIMALTKQCRVTLPPSVTAVSRGIVTLEGTLSEYIANSNIVDIINSHIMNKKDPKKELERIAQETLISLNNSSRGLATSAEYMGESLKMLSRGQLKVNMEMLGSDEPLKKVSRIANRLAVSMIIAGLLVSASLMTALDMPKIIGVPILSFIEFVSAFILTVVVAVDIYRRPKS